MTGVLPASAWLSNGGPAVYGGLIAWAAEFTMGAAVYSMLGAGDVFATLDLHIRFTRPARFDAGGLTFRAAVDHSGKRLRVTSCTVDDAEGRRVAMATSSALLVPGGVRELTKGRLPDEILADAERRRANRRREATRSAASRSPPRSGAGRVRDAFDRPIRRRMPRRRGSLDKRRWGCSLRNRPTGLFDNAGAPEESRPCEWQRTR